MKSVVVLTLFAGLVSICASEPILAADEGNVTATNGVKVFRDIQYSNVDGRLKLDIYEPEKFTGKLPVIVMIHGGGWNSADKGAWSFFGTDFAPRGYAVVCINYRYIAQALFPAQIIDCKTAVRWLRAHADDYHLDKNRVAAGGHSAGGHLSALLGVSKGVQAFETTEWAGERDDVQAVIDMAGPLDFIAGPETRGFEAFWNDPNPMSELIGGPIKANPEKAKCASPSTYVSKKSAPFIMFYGEKDTYIPHQQASAMFNALKRAGVYAELHILHGEGHGSTKYCSPMAYKQIEAFLRKHMK
jgi:acetyl esterase/lipase